MTKEQIIKLLGCFWNDAIRWNGEQKDKKEAFDLVTSVLCPHERNIHGLSEVKALQDHECHWYIVPNDLAFYFHEDTCNVDLIDSGEFDEKWGRYRTGGDLNLIQLWAELRS
jgi:hypothetical protein